MAQRGVSLTPACTDPYPSCWTLQARSHSQDSHDGPEGATSWPDVTPECPSLEGEMQVSQVFLQPPTPLKVQVPCERAPSLGNEKERGSEGRERGGRSGSLVQGGEASPIHSQGSGFWFWLPPLGLVFLPPSLLLTFVMYKIRK